MNALDRIELDYLEFTGDLETAELAGRILREQIEFAAYLFNIPPDELLTQVEVWPW